MKAFPKANSISESKNSFSVCGFPLTPETYGEIPSGYLITSKDLGCVYVRDSGGWSWGDDSGVPGHEEWRTIKTNYSLRITPGMSIDSSTAPLGTVRAS